MYVEGAEGSARAQFVSLISELPKISNDVKKNDGTMASRQNGCAAPISTRPVPSRALWDRNDAAVLAVKVVKIQTINLLS